LGITANGIPEKSSNSCDRDSLLCFTGNKQCVCVWSVLGYTVNNLTTGEDVPELTCSHTEADTDLFSIWWVLVRWLHISCHAWRREHD